MHKTLIVARMDPTDTEAVAKIFSESDATELPQVVGVSQRTLFRFHDLYFHLIESDAPPNFGKMRDNALFLEVNRRLDSHIKPYDPGWREPKDAVATQFYSWSTRR